MHRRTLGLKSPPIKAKRNRPEVPTKAVLKYCGTVAPWGRAKSFNDEGFHRRIASQP